MAQETKNTQLCSSLDRILDRCIWEYLLAGLTFIIIIRGYHMVEDTVFHFKWKRVK